MPKLRIAIVGCGAIGGSLAVNIRKLFAKQARISALFDTDFAKAGDLAKRVSSRAVSSAKQAAKISDLVIESARAADSYSIARIALENGSNVMIMSVGGIVEKLDDLRKIAAKKNLRVYLPSGAICGIDGLKALAMEKIKSVTLTTKKSPLSLKGVEYLKKKNIKLDGLKHDTVVFEGPAAKAIRYFPQNINVAAVLSIAGIGTNKTTVRIVASPTTKRNTHEINISSDQGQIYTRCENVLHPQNPKTSYLAVLSATAVIARILNPVQTGT